MLQRMRFGNVVRAVLKGYVFFSRYVCMIYEALILWHVYGVFPFTRFVSNVLFASFSFLNYTRKFLQIR